MAVIPPLLAAVDFYGASRKSIALPINAADET